MELNNNLKLKKKSKIFFGTNSSLEVVKRNKRKQELKVRKEFVDLISEDEDSTQSSPEPFKRKTFNRNKKQASLKTVPGELLSIQLTEDEFRLLLNTNMNNKKEASSKIVPKVELVSLKPVNLLLKDNSRELQNMNVNEKNEKTSLEMASRVKVIKMPMVDNSTVFFNSNENKKKPMKMVPKEELISIQLLKDKNNPPVTLINGNMNPKKVPKEESDNIRLVKVKDDSRVPLNTNGSQKEAPPKKVQRMTPIYLHLESTNNSTLSHCMNEEPAQKNIIKKIMIKQFDLNYGRDINEAPSNMASKEKPYKVHLPCHNDKEKFPQENENITEQVMLNEFDLFGNSVAAQLKSLPWQNAIELQLKIQHAITQYRLEMFNHKMLKD